VRRVRESWLVVVERCMGWRAVGVGGVEERKVDLQLRPSRMTMCCDARPSAQTWITSRLPNTPHSESWCGLDASKVCCI
jgi:hypothetical protein